MSGNVKDSPGGTVPAELMCATCSTPIPGIAAALVEWVFRDAGAAGFKIIHNMKSSPRGREGCFWHVFTGTDAPISHLEAEKFLDPVLLNENIAGKAIDSEALLHVLKILAGGAGQAVRVASALAGLGKDGVPLLAESLASEHIDERRAAALALARLGDKSLAAAAALTGVLDDEDPEVRFRSAFTLKILGGIDYQEKADAVIRTLAAVMGPIDAMEPFTVNSDLERGIINRETLVAGEVVVDVTGRTFLTPEEDYRGGGMGSVRLYGKRGRNGDLISVTSGIFDRDIGIWSENIEKK